MKAIIVRPAGADAHRNAEIRVYGAPASDINLMAERAMAEGLLLAPGSLFSPSQLPSTRMRLNTTAMQNPAVWRFFERETARDGP
jgi:DNA-binding transcriptional MocR family regulator